MNPDFLATAKRVINIEAKALQQLSTTIGASFNHACEMLSRCTGKVVVCGMGKSGHVGNKIAATLASTGTPAFFMHPAEANHGDLGMLSSNDVLVAISNSGETHELLNLLPVIKRLQVPIIAMTGQPHSTLAKCADALLNIHVEQEACPLGLAPTSSTTVTLVLGDALAIALLESKGFTADDFALSHPGGTLGRKLLLTVNDIMHSGDELPLVHFSQSLRNALLEISQKGLGMTGVIDDNKQLVGIFTDGDLRRSLDKHIDIHHTLVGDVMTPNSITILSNKLAINALSLMQKNKVSALFVVNESVKPIGAINMHMLLKAGVM